MLWHLERQDGRNFTVGVYRGVAERWDLATAKWTQAATGFFAEIRERLTEQPGDASATLRAFDRGSETLYVTRDEAYTLALRRVRSIVHDEGGGQGA